MIIDIARTRKHMVFPLLLQAASAGILVLALFARVRPCMDYPESVILERILGISNQLNTEVYLEIFLKIAIFIIIQFFLLTFLFKVFIETLCRLEVSYYDIALMICSPLLLISIILLCGLPWVFVTPQAVIPFLLVYFMITLLSNHISICSSYKIEKSKGIFLTTSAYLIYFIFIFICVIKV